MNFRVSSATVLSLVSGAVSAADPSSDTDWLHEARFGAFMHFLPGDSAALEKVDAFDVDALASQLASAHVRYFVLTLGQNSGFFNSPNATYDRITGYVPGERCSTRDLPLDLARALSKKNIRLMLYLPCQTPNRDTHAQDAFGLATGPKDQPIDVAFAHKWTEVIGEWSVRYGGRISGWWFDGGYQRVGFNDEIAVIYREAVKRGNAKSIAAYNPGVKLIRWVAAEDYTAGELNDPLDEIPSGRWVDGSQWHALTFVGEKWARREVRYSAQEWTDWAVNVVRKDGVLTLDVGPNWDPDAGPIGAISAPQLSLLQDVGRAIESIEK